MRANLSQVSRATTGQVRSRRAAADLDLAPAGLAAERDEQAVVEDLDPSGARPVCRGGSRGRRFRSGAARRRSREQDGAVAQAAQIPGRGSRSWRAGLRGGPLPSGPEAGHGGGGCPYHRPMWRSARSSGWPRWAKLQVIAESRRSIVRTEVGLRPRRGRRRRRRDRGRPPGGRGQGR